MLVAKLNRSGGSGLQFDDLIIGPFKSSDEIEEWCKELKVSVALYEIVDPNTFIGNQWDRMRIHVYNTKYDSIDNTKFDPKNKEQNVLRNKEEQSNVLGKTLRMLTVFRRPNSRRSRSQSTSSRSVDMGT